MSLGFAIARLKAFSHNISHPPRRPSKPDGPGSCVVVTGADDPQRLVLYLAMPGIDFEILDPPEVADAARAAAQRLRRAAGS